MGLSSSLHDNTYERRSATLIKGPQETVCLTALMYQAHRTHLYSKPLLETFYDLCTQHAHSVGTTKCLVRVGPRSWLPADPKDFVIFEGNRGVALACLNPVRTTVYDVLKTTEEDMARAGLLVAKNFGLRTYLWYKLLSIHICNNTPPKSP